MADQDHAHRHVYLFLTIYVKIEKELGKQRVVRERDQANVDHDSNTLVKMNMCGLMDGLGDDHSLDRKPSCGPRTSKGGVHRLAEGGGENRERLDGQCSRVSNVFP